MVLIRLSGVRVRPYFDEVRTPREKVLCTVRYPVAVSSVTVMIPVLAKWGHFKGVWTAKIK